LIKTPENRVNMESSWNETAKLSKKHLARRSRPNKSRTEQEKQKQEQQKQE
jgi:hypothetical protein